MASIAPSSCEHPDYPNWMWRYNRNQHLTKFEPWFTRVERWPPHYRNMGVGDNFHFQAVQGKDASQPMWQPGLNYAQELVEGRQTGSGNSALGLVPGPAPPRFVYPEVVPHQVGELLKINCIENLTEGASLLDHSKVPTQTPRRNVEPLNPRQYLEKTLGQRVEYPGTFPHINGAEPKTDIGSVVCCGGSISSGCNDPLSYWRSYSRRREEANQMEKTRIPRPFPEYCCEYGWERDKFQCISGNDVYIN